MRLPSLLLEKTKVPLNYRGLRATLLDVLNENLPIHPYLPIWHYLGKIFSKLVHEPFNPNQLDYPRYIRALDAFGCDLKLLAAFLDKSSYPDVAEEIEEYLEAISKEPQAAGPVQLEAREYQASAHDSQNVHTKARSVYHLFLFDGLRYEFFHRKKRQNREIHVILFYSSSTRGSPDNAAADSPGIHPHEAKVRHDHIARVKLSSCAILIESRHRWCRGITKLKPLVGVAMVV